MNRPPSSSPAPVGKGRGLSPRGCLLALAGAWFIWILIDVGRLGVLGGETKAGDAALHMPSLGIPLLLGLLLTPMFLRIWWVSHRQRAYPDQRWMWQKRWNPAGARPVVAAILMPTVIFAAVATTACGIVAFATVALIAEPLARWAIVPFALGAVGAWVVVAVRVGKAFRFGRPFFAYDTFPFFLGVQVSGHLAGLEAVGDFPQMTAVLRCVQERFSRGLLRSHQITETTRTVLREETRTFQPSDLVERADPASPIREERQVLPMVFPLPADAQETGQAADLAIRWELQVSIKRPGLDFDATFLLPVYRKPFVMAAEAPGPTGA